MKTMMTISVVWLLTACSTLHGARVPCQGHGQRVNAVVSAPTVQP